jgi:uncharacterized protein (DUF58 family)
MPTRRAAVIFGLALALYFVANQTQVGWVYVMTDLLLGLLALDFLYSPGLLGRIEGSRTFHRPGGEATADDDALSPPDFHEDDPIDITLQFSQPRLRPIFFVGGLELCPLAPPEDRQQSLFLPALWRRQPVNLRYLTTCHRRGVHIFPPLRLRTDGPFHLFTRTHALPVPGEVLIYPQYLALQRLRLLENRGFTDRHTLNVGPSSEVIGTREYRSGDSLRRVHWRSTARLGRLVVKDYADSDHLTMTVVLDLSRRGSVGEGKFSTFETAIRVAASLGYYATHHNIPFRLMGSSEQWRPPDIALSWWGVLHYLARTQNDGQTPLAEVLRGLPPTPFVVALVSRPDEATRRELAALPKRGSHTLALMITPENDLSPPEGGNEKLRLAGLTPHNWREVLQTL